MRFPRISTAIAMLCGGLHLASLFSLTGCQKNQFEQLIEQSKGAGYNQVALPKSDLPFFKKRLFDPTWETSRPEDLIRVDRFNAKDHHGKHQNEQLFRKTPTIVTFFFSRCGGLCPMMIGNLEKIEKEIGSELPVQFVAITLDPEHDTPENLNSYVRKLWGKKQKSNWHFLTMSQEEVDKLTQQTFAIEITKKSTDRILHSERFFIVDAAGFVRGAVNGTEVRMPKKAKETLLALRK